MEIKMILTQLNSEFSELEKNVTSVEKFKFFHKERDDKWSIAEHLHHLSLTLIPINSLLKQPFVITERWGHSNRKSRNIDSFTVDYNRATTGQEWKSFPPFVPKEENENQNYSMIHHTRNQNKIDDFYQLTGQQIQGLRDQFKITSSMGQKDIIKTFSTQSQILLSLSQALDEGQMDDLQVPLPYMGLVTFKEFLFFTLFHTNSHHQTIKKILN